MKAYILKKTVLVHDWAPHPVIISHISGFIWLVNMLNLAKMFIYIYTYTYIYIYIALGLILQRSSQMYMVSTMCSLRNCISNTGQNSEVASSNVIRNSWQKCLKKKYYIKGTVSRDRQRSHATLISFFLFRRHLVSYVVSSRTKCKIWISFLLFTFKWWP